MHSAVWKHYAYQRRYFKWIQEHCYKVCLPLAYVSSPTYLSALLFFGFIFHTILCSRTLNLADIILKISFVEFFTFMYHVPIFTIYIPY
jgi:hypothetical protein